MPKSHPTFTTTDSNGTTIQWHFVKPKDTGSRSAGKFGGFYTSDPVTENIDGFIKQDKSANNIAEFLAGRIYQAMAPDVTAKIYLTRVDSKTKRSHDGSNVYVVSEFIPHWQHDLYTEVQKAEGKSPTRSKTFLVEALQISHVMGKLKKFFKSKKDVNFGEISAPSLLINNIDTHIANLGIVHLGSTKKLAIIDYGASWRAMTKKIHPNNFLRITFMHLGEAWNNFRLYPESIKITPDFVAQLDRAASIDLDDVIENAFEDLKKYYGVKPIIEFAIRAGLLSPSYAKTLLAAKLDTDSTDEIIDFVRDQAIDVIKQRQLDLARFSAQIKMDLCVKKEGKSMTLSDSFQHPTSKQQMTFDDVVFQHLDYFKEVFCKEHTLKFRKSEHKKNTKLVGQAKHQSLFVLASVVLANPAAADIREKFGLTKIPQIVYAMQNGKLWGKNLSTALNCGKDKQKIITLAKKHLAEHKKSQLSQHHATLHSAKPDKKQPSKSKSISLKSK